MGKKWVATCDEPGCAATVTAPASRSSESFGMQLNDDGWAAGPGRSETYCDAHYREFEVLPRDLAEEERSMAAFVKAMAENDRRAARRRLGK